MLRRNLLYTAVTRAKRLVVLLAEPEALERAVRDARRRASHHAPARAGCADLELHHERDGSDDAARGRAERVASEAGRSGPRLFPRPRHGSPSSTRASRTWSASPTATVEDADPPRAGCRLSGRRLPRRGGGRRRGRPALGHRPDRRHAQLPARHPLLGRASSPGSRTAHRACRRHLRPGPRTSSGPPGAAMAPPATASRSTVSATTDPDQAVVGLTFNFKQPADPYAALLRQLDRPRLRAPPHGLDRGPALLRRRRPHRRPGHAQLLELGRPPRPAHRRGGRRPGHRLRRPSTASSAKAVPSPAMRGWRRW